MDEKTFWSIIKYLVGSGLIQKSKDLYSINIQKYNAWNKKSIENVMEKFYGEIAGGKVINFLEVISKQQNAPDEWIDLRIINNISLEYDRAKFLGLISTHVEDEITYVQLSPEAWMLTKKFFHPLWNEQAILVSASFEVFFPFQYEPFILNEMLPFCTLKDSHYFLVLIYRLTP